MRLKFAYLFSYRDIFVCGEPKLETVHIIFP